jgi:predicted dehydrogenase
MRAQLERLLMLRLGIIGAGLKAAEYARGWTAMSDVQIAALAEIDPASRQRLSDICAAAGRPRPAEYESDQAMLGAASGRLDAVYVATPHVFHAGNALAVIDAGLDLLLEKPMVTTVAEALALAEAEKRTARTIVIAFQGGLSPLIHDTVARARRGEFGSLVSVSASIWEGWARSYAGHWKQKPSISGGGFMFDTGAHMMNTVCLLADAEFERLSAFTNNRGLEVDLVCAVAARLANGALVTFNAAGVGPPGCASSIHLFYTNALVRIDAWGAWREVAVGGGVAIREVNEIVDTPMHTFKAVREGRLSNPSTVTNGVRFARLWDAIKASAAADGKSIAIESGAG